MNNTRFGKGLAEVATTVLSI